MKKWIALITAAACAFSSTLPADGAPPAEAIEAPAVEESAVVQDPPTQAEPERKSVGTAAADGSETASSSNVGKYLLAGGAIAVGVVALILISRNSGHHKH